MRTFPFLVFVMWCGCSPVADWNTQYSQPNLKKHFSEVKVGDSIENVYRTIGPPLWVHINHDVQGSGAYKQETSFDVSISTLMTIATNANKELLMVYSQPKKAGKDYLYFYVQIHYGKVSRKQGPVYMD